MASIRALPTSCDTFVAVGGAGCVRPQLSSACQQSLRFPIFGLTILFVFRSGAATLLGKNSDRPAFDCQPLRRCDAAEHATNAKIQLEYRAIPQAPRTRATCGSSPYWCWGFEMGMNDAGVRIPYHLARCLATSHQKQVHLGWFWLKRVGIFNAELVGGDRE